MNGSFSGIVTTTSGLQGANVKVGMTSARTIDTSSGSLFLGAADDRVTVDGTLSVLTNENVEGNLDVAGTGQISNVNIGVNSTTQIESTAGNLKLDSATNTIDINAQTSITGIATFNTGLKVATGQEGAIIGNIGIGTVNDQTISTELEIWF